MAGMQGDPIWVSQMMEVATAMFVWQQTYNFAATNTDSWIDACQALHKTVCYKQNLRTVLGHRTLQRNHTTACDRLQNSVHGAECNAHNQT